MSACRWGARAWALGARAPGERLFPCLLLLLLAQGVSGWSLAAGSRLVGAALLLASSGDKLVNLPDVQFLATVEKDISERQALVTADFTRAIYSEDCTFQDEIDTYKINEYVKGTKALFDSSNSHVELASSPVFIDPEHNKVEYKFRETLVFNIPFRPRVDLSGKVQLTRDETTGLVKASREIWDNDVPSVLSHIYF